AIYPDTQYRSRALDDKRKLFDIVHIEPVYDAEPVPQGRCQQSRPGCSTHKREFGQIQPDGAGTRPFAYDYVKREILHRRVKYLFHGPVEAVYLIYEQNVEIAEVGKYGCQVAGPFYGRPGSDADIDAE